MIVLSIFLDWPRGGTGMRMFHSSNHRDSELAANQKSPMIFSGTPCIERQFATKTIFIDSHTQL